MHFCLWSNWIWENIYYGESPYEAYTKNNSLYFHAEASYLILLSWQSGPGGESTEEFGINQLALNDLFLLADERKDIMSYKIHVQMVEIYNEQIRDLLADDPLLTKYPFIVIFP